MVEMKEQLNITDMKGNKIGVMNVEVSSAAGKMNSPYLSFESFPFSTTGGAL